MPWSYVEPPNTPQPLQRQSGKTPALCPTGPSTDWRATSLGALSWPNNCLSKLSAAPAAWQSLWHSPDSTPRLHSLYLAKTTQLPRQCTSPSCHSDLHTRNKRHVTQLHCGQVWRPQNQTSTTNSSPHNSWSYWYVHVLWELKWKSGVAGQPCMQGTTHVRVNGKQALLEENGHFLIRVLGLEQWP